VIQLLYTVLYLPMPFCIACWVGIAGEPQWVYELFIGLEWPSEVQQFGKFFKPKPKLIDIEEKEEEAKENKKKDTEE